MIQFDLTVTRDTYGIRPHSVAGAGAGVCLLAIQRLGLGLILILAEDYMIRVEQIDAFVASMIWVAAIEAKPLI